MLKIDYTALTEPVTPLDVKVFRKKTSPLTPPLPLGTAIAFVVIVVMVGGVFFSIPMFLIRSTPENPTTSLLPFVVLTMGAVAAVVYFTPPHTSSMSEISDI
ncbi:MAG: hypothetical protein ABIW32_08655 [Terrimesophilobacter sp.]